ncbi:MAG: hypothetical protein QY302_13575 [Anaerolineales bacterium]|nr:MAG: hypothetical protein QY302_13575 [Anaerolineales bacterium]
MADIRCPNCGKVNPDFLDNCQFCQTPLKPEAMVHLGDNPVKKNTGELEPILPQWLKDVRQQGRDSAAEDAEEEAAKPKVQKNEPPDLLAGLASQAKSDDEEVPDWLASMNPVTQPASPAASAPPPETDFFAQFNEASKPASVEPQASEPAEEAPALMADLSEAQPTQEKDELSEWFAQASAEPAASVEIESDLTEWTTPSDAPSYAFKEPPPQPKAEEDLSWLHSLEESSKEESAPPAQQDESGSGLGWLDDLGKDATDVPPGRPATDEPPSWVRKLGGVESTAQPEQPRQDLSWMDQLASPVSSPAEEKPAESSPVWLQDLENKQGDETPPEKVSAFTRRTGPLSDVPDDLVPDWLISATEEPSMPAPGALADWFRETDISPQSPISAGSDSSKVPQPSSGEDVDSLLSADMPAWLSQPEPEAEESPSQIPGIPADESLAPGELPSWVREMRPAESAIPGETPRKDQYTESEGPLAGLEGVIPVAPIGSSRRPKALSLKLQPSDEQIAGATLLEQILASETTARPIAAQSNLASQRVLRWILSALFLIVLGATAFARTTSLPVSASLPPAVQSASSAIARLPQNSLILVVIDYEPALSGEMEAVSGPLLDQLVLTTHARLTFVSTSPNSTALVRRLLANTGLSLPPPNGLGYQAGENYVNLGYLPGGFTGIREFLESPTTVLPQAGQAPNFAVTKFTDYAAVVVLTDHPESGRAWVEQLSARNRADPTFFSVQPVFFATSAQAGPMLQPYFASQQITGMVNGLADAARYEFVNNSRPGIVRRYWDSFGVGLLLAVVAITLGSLWSLVAGLRARRASEEAG